MRLAFALAGMVLFGPAMLAGAPPSKPNIVIFYIDDMGYAQPGCYGGKLAPTPHIDALAAAGVRFTNGYVSACVCSPSRVGLLTGRYQQRTGHDANTTRAGTELDLREVTIAQRLKLQGYTTGIIGKWHLGESPQHLPGARGFDVAFGSVSNLGKEGVDFYRGTQIVDPPAEAPITSPRYASEAVTFIQSAGPQPFLLYLSFNAVHAPHVARDAVLQRFSGLDNRSRQYAGIITEVDDAIGLVMRALRERNLEEQTLVFVISDNGGAAAQAEMGGLRGRKWTVWEGGIRVPFIVTWKGRIPGGRVSHVPVIQLDVLPTALAAAGGEISPDWQLDGVNLLPLLEGKTDKLPRQALYWRFGTQYAVRAGDWKLVKAVKDQPPLLVNLQDDPGEQTDLSTSHPDKRQELAGLWERWNATMQPPRWEDRRWDRTDDDAEAKTAAKTKKRIGNME